MLLLLESASTEFLEKKYIYRCNINFFVLQNVNRPFSTFSNVSNGQLNFKGSSKTSLALTHHYNSQGKTCSYTDLETYITIKQSYQGIKAAI